MNTNTKEFVDLLVSLEPIFRQAGDLAKKLRPSAVASKKSDTGIAGVDIITDADLAVQEFVLSEIAKTNLINCALIAEVDTPSVSKFKGTNGLVLTIDPIDGTRVYAEGGNFYSIIICLHDKKSYHYVYLYYPEVDWTRRITDSEVIDFGQLPKAEIKVGLDLERVIAHAHRSPEKTAPEMYDEMINRGYTFKSIEELTFENGPWPMSLFFVSQLGGFYDEMPCSYDGVCVLYYGQVKGLEVLSVIDIANPFKNDRGIRYPGWYLVLK